MNYRCTCLDLGDILNRPSLASHVLENIRYSIPGFGCDYHLCTFDNNIEFTLRVTSEDNTLKKTGLNLHFCGDNFWNVVCQSVIDNQSTSYECVVHSSKGSDNCFPLRIICPDVLAEIKQNCKLYGQVAAFVSSGTLLKEPPDTAHSVSAIDLHSVSLTGEIIDIERCTFSFEEISRDYYALDVDTDLGRISAVVLEKNLNGTPEVGDILSAVAYISLDVAVPSSHRESTFYKQSYTSLPGDNQERDYQYGCIRNYSNALTILCDAATQKDISRFGRCCVEKVRFSDALGNEQILARWSAVQKLNEIITVSHTTEKVLNIEFVDASARFPGGILLDNRQYVIISTDEDGLVEHISCIPVEGTLSDNDIEKHLLYILANALCYGKINQLHAVMSETCTYRSDFSGKQKYGRHAIVDSMIEVASVLSEETAYHYELVPAVEEIREDAQSDLPGALSGRFCLRLWQECEGDTPVAIVFIRYNDDYQITNILLSRDENYLKVFSENWEPMGKRPEYPRVDDLLQQAFGIDNTIASMRKKDCSVPDAQDIYVWQKADRFIQNWLREMNYRVNTTELFDDCIGYACSRSSTEYAVYVYAYGERKTSLLDGDYCAKLRNHKLSENRTILVVYLHVTAEAEENGDIKFYVGKYNTKDTSPEVWKLGWIGNRSVLLFYPHKEMVDLVQRFIAAYNSQRLDILRTILAEKVSLNPMDHSHTMNDAVYSNLSYFHKNLGLIKTAYIRFNDVVYSRVPYISNYCYITFAVNQKNKIDNITFHPLDESYRELIVTDEILTSHPMDNVPTLEKVEFLPPSDRARFSMLLYFANGETKRYDAPGAFGDDNVITWMDATFTDKIFRNGRIANPVRKNNAMFYRNYPQQHQGVEFINGAAISTVELYHNSYPVGRFHYSDGPDVFDYDSNDDRFTVGYIRNLDPADPLYLLDTKSKVATVIPEQYQETPVICYPPCGGCSEGMIMVSTMGKLDLQYHHNRYACAGMWGWLDTELNTIIEPQYVFALNFFGGRALVCKGEWGTKEVNGKLQYWCENEQWGVIDKTGQDVVPCRFDELYEIGDTDRLYFVHEGGWENGHYAIFDMQKQTLVLELDFEFDMGYMFNECFVSNGDILVFINHLPGDGMDLIYAYDLHAEKYIAYAEQYTERTFNGQSKVVVTTADGQEIIVF